METIKDILFLFSFALSIGSFLFLPLVSTKLTGAGFLRLICSVSLGALAICFGLELVQGSKMGALLSLGIGVCLSLQYFLHQDKKTKPMWLLYFLTLILAGIKIYWHFSPYYMVMLYLVSVILFLGGANYLMLLGHYYLVVPKLTTRPLIIGSYLIWVILILKIAFALWAYFENQAYFAEGTTLGMGYIFNQILLWMRVLWGFAAVIAMNYMGYRCSKISSTQSATGILYIMLFFVIIGELISLYFFRAMGVLGL